MAMNFQRYTGGSRVSIGDVRRNTGGAWQDVNTVYALEGGVWVKVWERKASYPDLAAASVLQMSKYHGGGTYQKSNANRTMALRISDPVATANSDIIWMESREFSVRSPITLSCTYEFFNNYHSPLFEVFALEDGYRLDYFATDHVSGERTFSLNFPESDGPCTLLMKFYMSDKGTHEIHQDELWLNNPEIGGRVISF